jgi:hypothetical protein
MSRKVFDDPVKPDEISLPWQAYFLQQGPDVLCEDVRLHVVVMKIEFLGQTDRYEVAVDTDGQDRWSELAQVRIATAPDIDRGLYLAAGD